MNDTLNITGLQVSTQIGIHAWEQRIRQPLRIDLQLPLHLENCQDNIKNTIDYAKLCEDIMHFVESQSFLLIETVAEAIALRLKTQYAVASVTVIVHKPHAVKCVEDIHVRITR